MTAALKMISERRLSAGCSVRKYPMILPQPPTIAPKCLRKPDNYLKIASGCPFVGENWRLQPIEIKWLRGDLKNYENVLIWARRWKIRGIMGQATDISNVSLCLTRSHGQYQHGLTLVSR